MRDISDISSLYREFGGDPRNYREIGQEGRAAAACGRWPLLGRIRPGVAAVPPAVGGPADRPARVAPWPLVAVATLVLPPAAGYPPVRAGGAIDGERALALVRSARVQRIALDALVLPVAAPEAEWLPPIVAAPAGLAGDAAAAPCVESGLAPAEPPVDAPPLARIEPPAALPLVMPAPDARSATPLQSVFARLAKAPGPPSSNTAKA